MNTITSNVDWRSYAEKYDMLLDYNPFYQDLRKPVLQIVEKWDFQANDRIIDIGAGTGNYSIAIAEMFPQAEVIHLDNNDGMCAVASQKKIQKGLANLQIAQYSVETLNFEPESLAACLCIHSLYTLPEPHTVIQKIHHWLKPGAIALFVDPGRTVKVFNWQLAIGWQMIKKYGLGKTLELFREGKEISHQNREIAKLHAKGIYWKHSHEEFCEAVREAGFTIHKTQLCFRGISDLVLVEK